MSLDEYDDDVVEKAYWLARHLQKNGLPAIRFMAAAEHWAQREGRDEVADSIDDSLDSM